MKVYTDDEAMELAIQEGQKGWGTTSPNPSVGCVILNDKRELIGKGFHRKAGCSHAEVEAIKSVHDLEQLKGAHVFVTLEPCAETGRTPACAGMLQDLPIAKITYGLKDPNPSMKDGHAILEAAGKKIALYKGPLEEKLKELCEIFLHNQKTNKPFVALKFATTLDGKISSGKKEQTWLTGALAREKVHHIRSKYDAIMVGRKTLEIDDPELNIRFGPHIGKELTVVVMDPQGKCLSAIEHSKIFRAHKPQNIYWVIGEDTQVQDSILPSENIISVPWKATGLDLESFLIEAYKKGIHSLLVEGGGRTIAEFFIQKKVQRVYQLLAPVVWGESGRSWSDGIEDERDINLQSVQTHMLDQDILLSGLVRESGQRFQRKV